MVLQHYQGLSWFQEISQRVTTPLYRFVDRPLGWWHGLLRSSVQFQILEEENAKQRAQILLLQAKLTRVQTIESENAQLLRLLRSSSMVPGKVLVANMLSLKMNGYGSDFLIDKGSEQGVYQGQPVLDGYGVVGQVLEVHKQQALVRDLRDEHSGVPVEIERNHIRGVVTGDNERSLLKLLYLTRTHDVQVGDKLITSGLGQQFPSGYPVGEVLSVHGQASQEFLTISVKPLGHLEQSRQLLLVWPNKKVQPQLVRKDPV